LSDLVTRLQQTLEYFYRVEGPVSATDFCIRKDQIDALFGRPAEPHPREALYLSAGRDATTDIGLFIDPAEMRKAERFVRAPQGDKLDAFCVALEGVSHFLYLTYCQVALERPVSQIELELQAEIDKYLLLRVIFGFKDSVSRLFQGFSWHESVKEEAQERYRVAHQQAKRYARWMEQRVRKGDIRYVLDDARRFYRKPLSCKLAHIACV